MQIIKNSPFEFDPSLSSNKLSSMQMKKLLSEFLDVLLPKEMPADYKTGLHSVRYYLNKFKVIGILMSMVMRYILFSNYEISTAEDYQL